MQRIAAAGTESTKYRFDRLIMAARAHPRAGAGEETLDASDRLRFCFAAPAHPPTSHGIDLAFSASSLFAPLVLGPMTANWDVTAEMASLRVPILLAHGRYDYVSPHTMWNGIVDVMPNSTQHVFERSGHQTFFEEPARFVEVVREWMARAGSSARQ